MTEYRIDGLLLSEVREMAIAAADQDYSLAVTFCEVHKYFLGVIGRGTSFRA